MNKNRAFSYYTKGLPVSIRQTLFHHMTNKLYPVVMKEFGETDHRSFHLAGMSDEHIQLFWEVQKEKIITINRIMTENGRSPFFSDPDDPYKCSREYFHLMDYIDDTILQEYFGCTYDEYVPEQL